LPPIAKDKQYTLVLDLDETLVHYDEQTEELNLRPHVISFLTKLAKYYELVIFTAGMKDYADWALS
jgi:CTD small phosphatase-like protein 2